MKICTNCGHKCNDSDQFCNACGNQFDEDEEKTDKVLDDEQNATDESETESETVRIRYSSGPLGLIRPGIFWPIAGVIYFFICLYNPGHSYWGILVGMLRAPDSIREWEYLFLTLIIVTVLVYI